MGKRPSAAGLGQAEGVTLACWSCPAPAFSSQYAPGSSDARAARVRLIHLGSILKAMGEPWRLSAGKFTKSASLVDSASGQRGEVRLWKAMVANQNWSQMPGFECQHFHLKVIQVASSYL